MCFIYSLLLCCVYIMLLMCFVCFLYLLQLQQTCQWHPRMQGVCSVTCVSGLLVWRYYNSCHSSICAVSIYFFFYHLVQGLHAQRTAQVLEVCPKRARHSSSGSARFTGSQGSVCVHGSLFRPWWDHLAAQTCRQHSEEKHRWLHWQVNPILTPQHSFVF